MSKSLEESLQNITNRLDVIEDKISKIESPESVITTEYNLVEEGETSDLLDKHQENYFNRSFSQDKFENPIKHEVPKEVDIESITPREVIDGEIKIGRWIGKIGVLAILAGFAFFLKYTFDNNIITELGRMILGLCFGALFVASGFMIPKKYSVYRDTLAAGGVLLWYLTVYVGNTAYYLVSNNAAFFLYVVIVIATCSMAVTKKKHFGYCPFYTSEAADESLGVDFRGRRII